MTRRAKKGAPVLDTESLDIADTRWIAVSSSLSAHKLASMCGAHPLDVARFLDRECSLTWAVRRRMREQISSQPAAGVPYDEGIPSVSL